MNKVEKVVSSYSVKDDYVVEVIIQDDYAEFWLYKRGYGIKQYMFGIPKENIKNENVIIDLIKYNFNAYTNIYKKEVID